MTLPGKEAAWSMLQEAVENSIIYALCRGAQEQLSLARGRLKLSKQCEAHFTGILYALLKQRADTKLLKLKPKLESVKQLAQVCELLVQLPAIDALVVDHVAWDPKTLSKFMRTIAEAPCSVLVTSTVAPPPADGWRHPACGPCPETYGRALDCTGQRPCHNERGSLARALHIYLP